MSCWETLVEGAHSLSLPWRSHSAISSDDTWNTDFMFHSCPHSSPLQCQSSTPVVQCSNVLSFPPFVLFWLFLNRVFSVPVLSLCLSLSMWRLLRPATGHTSHCELGRVQPLTFLVGILTRGSPSGGPQRAGLMSTFYLYLFVCLFLCLFAWWRMVGVALPAALVLIAICKGEVRSWSSSLSSECCVCLDESSPKTSDPVVAPHGCMHVAPLLVRRCKWSVKMWKCAVPYLKYIFALLWQQQTICCYSKMEAKSSKNLNKI